MLSMQFVGPVRNGKDERHLDDVRREVLQQLERRLIGPVQIFDHNDTRAFARSTAQPRRNFRKLPAFRSDGVGAQLRRRRITERVQHVDHRTERRLRKLETEALNDARFVACDMLRELGDET